MLILKILYLRIKTYFILIFKYYLLFNKYFKLFNFLFMLLVAPMDFKNIYEMFNALVNESEVENDSKEPDSKEKEPWLDNEKKLAIVTLIILVAVIVWYWSVMSGGTPSLDLSKFNRIVPETPIDLDLDTEAGKPSLLDEDYNIKMEAREAREAARAAAREAAAALNSGVEVGPGPIQSKHW